MPVIKRCYVCKKDVDIIQDMFYRIEEKGWVVCVKCIKIFNGGKHEF